MLGASPSFARAYSVRLEMYTSELAAEKMKTKIHPFRKPGSVLIPLSIMATTNGDAAALVDALFANARFGELYGTSIPTLIHLVSQRHLARRAFVQKNQNHIEHHNPP